jgi:hypothetical protein
MLAAYSAALTAFGDCAHSSGQLHQRSPSRRDSYDLSREQSKLQMDARPTTVSMALQR